MDRYPMFEHHINVDKADMDVQGHVNNVVYLRYVQDAAIAHWFAASSPELRAKHLWVVRRHEIDYFKPAFVSDRLVARTWVEPFKGATCERLTEIHRPSDKQILVTARSLWILLDPISRRPRRANENLQRLFEKHCNGQESAL